MPPVTPSAMSATYSSSILTTLRRRISFCAIAIFLSPSSRGTAPFISWRQHEDADRLGAAAPPLPGPLHVDHEHDVRAGGEAPLRVGRARPIVVAEDVGPLQELAGARHLLEALPADEIIVNAVLLAGARLARRVRARQAEIRDPLHQPFDQRRLARAGRRGDDEEQAPAPSGVVGPVPSSVEGPIQYSGPARASSRAPPSR